MEVEAGSYWRHRISRHQIEAVVESDGCSKVITRTTDGPCPAGCCVDGRRTTHYFDYFLDEWEPLNRLEVLVLFGEV